jgi:hypothetical protein
MFPHSLPWPCPYAALGSKDADACRECDGGGNAPWFKFGEVCGLGFCWLFMVGSRWGGVGECACVVAIWLAKSEGLCCG